MVNIASLAVGQFVLVQHSKPGIVRYIGRVKFADGEWVGVELEAPNGEHDGVVQGMRYFSCQPNHGIFVHASDITVELSGFPTQSTTSFLRNGPPLHSNFGYRPNSSQSLISSPLHTPQAPRTHSSIPRLAQTALPSPSMSPMDSFSPFSLDHNDSTSNDLEPELKIDYYDSNSSQTDNDRSSIVSLMECYVWGENQSGELGVGDANDRRIPTLLPNLGAEIAQISLGLRHSICLTMSNDVYSCGSWVSGVLGHQAKSNVHRFKKLKQFAKLKQEDPNNPIVSLCCSDRHNVALHASGELYTWGGSLYGKLGRKGSGAESGSVYYLVSALQGKRVTNVDCGNCHTAVCTDEGEVYTFGGGGKFYNRGQLGVHDMEDSLLPRRIESFGNKIFIRQVCCGGYHTLALSAACHVYSWGRGDFGQLGLGHENNETEPRLVESLVKIGSIVALDAGENHSIACAETGEVFTWGFGQQGQLGHGNGMNSKSPKKVKWFVENNIAVIQVGAGWRHSIVLTLENEVYTWGHGDRGQLGHGDTRNCLFPTKVEALEGLGIKQIAAGGTHSLACTQPFKAAQEMVNLDRIRREAAKHIQERKEKEIASKKKAAQRPYASESNSPVSSHRPSTNRYTSRPATAAPSITHSRSVSQTSFPGTPLNLKQEQEKVFEDERKSQLHTPTSNNSSSSQILDLTSNHTSTLALPSPQTQPSLCVEIVYSAQVHLVHRFATFQTKTPESIFSTFIKAYVDESYAVDSGLVFHNYIVSPGNSVPRIFADGDSFDQIPPEDALHDSHIYSYDQGPSRVTLMLVTRTLPADEDLWPAWASTLFEGLVEICYDIASTPSTDPKPSFSPCFREIRPASLEATLRPNSGSNTPARRSPHRP